MNWLKSIFEKDEKSAEDGFEKIDHFQGTWKDAERHSSRLTTAIETLMEHAMNRRRPDGSTEPGVRLVGEKMKFELKGVVVAVKDLDSGEIGPDHLLGDYTITVERVA